MPTTEGLSLVIGVSTFLGLLGLLAYLYFLQQFRHVERSVRQLVEGEGLFNANQVLRILEQFKGDAARLEALKALAHYDTNKAQGILTKIKENVDVTRLQRLSIGHYRYVAAVSAVVFLVLAALALVYSFARVPDVPVAPTASFEVFHHDRVVDLSGWKVVPESEKTQKVSKVAWHDRLKVKRLGRDFNEFVLRRAVTGTIEPEFFSPTHRISVRLSKDVPLSGPRPIDRLFDVVVDVSNEPVNEWFDLAVDAVYWNVFLEPASRWVAIPIQFKTTSIRFELLSPNRPFRAFQREAYARSDQLGNRLVNEPTAQLSEDGTTIVWRVSDVRENWIYKIAWEW